MIDDFEQLTRIYKQMNFKDNSSEVSLLLNSENDCNFIKKILVLPREYGIELTDSTKSINEIVQCGKSINLLVSPPRIGLGRLYNGYSDLLRSTENLYKEPVRFFIKESKFFNCDTFSPDFIKNYRAIINFLSLLKNASAYFDESNSELVFFDHDLFKISINYSVDDVCNLDFDELEILFSLFNEDTHKEQKLKILIESIKTITDEIQPDLILSHTINNIKLLKYQFDKGYRIFSSAFSYDKVMDKLRAAKVEEIGKIHKTVADIQNQILGIPVATIVIATQMKEANQWGYQSIVNSAVLFGCFIFSFLVILMLCNQLQTLKAIKEELKYKKKQVKREYSLISEDINDVFDNISTRLLIQKIAFYIIGSVLIIGLLSTTIIYFYLTEPVWNYIITFLGCN